MSSEAYFEKLLSISEITHASLENSKEKCYNLGSFKLRVRYAGSSLFDLIHPSLAHLEVASRPEPNLKIWCWDGVSSKIEIPGPPWDRKDYIERSEISIHDSDFIQASYNLDGGLLCMLNSKSNTGLYWIQSASQLPYYEIASPFRKIFFWWMKDRNHHIAHSAALGLPEGGVIIAGKSGSGKSTTSLSCLMSDLLFAGDDYVVLKETPNPHVFSLYNTAKLFSEDLSKFPHLHSLIQNDVHNRAEKAILFLYKAYPKKVISEFPLKAVLIPRISGNPFTTIRNASPALSLRALAPSTIFQQAGAGQETFTRLASLVRRVPSYILDLGPDFSQIPGVILDLLSKA